MLEGSEKHWTTREIYQKSKQGLINYDHVVQRGLIWDNKHKSLLIASILEGFPIPPIYINIETKNNDINYVLDGKQRCYSIIDFVDNKFRIANIPIIQYKTIIGEDKSIDINGMCFADMPEELKTMFMTQTFIVCCYFNLTEWQTREMFYRLNNGVGLNVTEKLKSKAVSLDQIVELSNHELFTKHLSAAKVNRSYNIELVEKTWLVLFDDKVSFKKSYMENTLSTREMTENEYNVLSSVFDRMLLLINSIKNSPTNKGTARGKQLSNIFFRLSHFTSIVSVVYHSLIDNGDFNTLTKWLQSFYIDGKAKSEEFTSLLNATGDNKRIIARTTIMLDDYRQFVQINKKEGYYEIRS